MLRSGSVLSWRLEQKLHPMSTWYLPAVPGPNRLLAVPGGLSLPRRGYARSSGVSRGAGLRCNRGSGSGPALSRGPFLSRGDGNYSHNLRPPKVLQRANLSQRLRSNCPLVVTVTKCGTVSVSQHSFVKRQRSPPPPPPAVLIHYTLPTRYAPWHQSEFETVPDSQPRGANLHTPGGI